MRGVEYLGKLIARFVVIFVGTFVAGSVQVAHGHADCAVRLGTPDVYIGDEHQNICSGNDNFDSFYGEAMGDALSGQGGRDKIRGAHGNDTLTDGQGNGDEDRSCDGDGLDYVQFQDGDPDDIGYFVLGDGEQDLYQANGLDVADFYSEAGGCPLVEDR
jgi:hypothetical protein